MMRVVALGLSALSWPSLACRALGGTAPRPVPQLAALAPAATVPAVVAVPVAAARSWRLALALAGPAAVLAWWQFPRRRARGAAAANARHPGDRGIGPELRILTVNAQFGRADADQLVNFVADQAVDVLAVQEVTEELVSRLDKAGLADVLPHGVVDARPAAGGTGIWSRQPLQTAGPVPGMDSAAPQAVLSLGGRPVTVTAVHVRWPMHNLARDWQRELAVLTARAAAAGGPGVLTGDFNASADHRPFRRLVAAGYLSCADAAVRRRWPAGTWPASPRRVPVMRLDHVLVTRDDFTVRECRTVPVAGTDHRGVLAVVHGRWRV